MEKEKINSTSHVIDSRLAMYWERFAIAIACILVSLCGWMYVKQDHKIDSLDSKIQQLQIDKVSRQELKDMEDRMTNRMDGMKGDIIFHINMLRDKR